MDEEKIHNLCKEAAEASQLIDGVTMTPAQWRKDYWQPIMEAHWKHTPKRRPYKPPIPLQWRWINWPYYGVWERVDTEEEH
jgi:hypothetical protein